MILCCCVTPYSDNNKKNCDGTTRRLSLNELTEYTWNAAIIDRWAASILIFKCTERVRTMELSHERMTKKQNQTENKMTPQSLNKTQTKISLHCFRKIGEWTNNHSQRQTKHWQHREVRKINGIAIRSHWITKKSCRRRVHYEHNNNQNCAKQQPYIFFPVYEKWSIQHTCYNHNVRIFSPAASQYSAQSICRSIYSQTVSFHLCSADSIL